MTFLAPLLLALATAALVPLLLHLLRRRAGSKMDFPAARYLARAEQENKRTLRLRNLLLMLLRVAAVVLVALAAARPIARFVGVGHAPSAIAIVIDNSLSSTVVVDGRPLLDLLRDAALEIIDRATSADRVWLVDAAGVGTAGSVAVVRAAISELEPLAGSGDMTQALARAASLVEESELSEMLVVVFTDGQRFEWDALQVGDAGESSVHLYTPIVSLPQNSTVVGADPRPARWTPAGEVVVRIAGGDSASYRIDLGARTLARGSAAPGEEVVVRATPHERGWLSGAVEIQPDELRADDIRHFAVWIGAAPSVRALPSAGQFISSAIDALTDAGRITDGTAITVGDADEIARLPAIIFPPSDPVRIGAANRALERLAIPYRFGEISRGSVAVRPSAGSSWADDGVVATERYQLTASGVAVADTLATAAGEPWLVSGPGYALFATRAHPDAGNLPVRASFVSLLAELFVQRLAGEGGGVVPAFPGAVTPRPQWADAIVDSIQGNRPLDGATFLAPTQAGTHLLARAGQIVGALVVNPPAGEFELQRMAVAELRNRLPDENASVNTTVPQLAQRVFESTGGRPLGLPLLLLALGALVLESIVARTAWSKRSI